VGWVEDVSGANAQEQSRDALLASVAPSGPESPQRYSTPQRDQRIAGAQDLP
jgi:hypothetical protein